MGKFHSPYIKSFFFLFFLSKNGFLEILFSDYLIYTKDRSIID